MIRNKLLEIPKIQDEKEREREKRMADARSCFSCGSCGPWMSAHCKHYQSAGLPQAAAPALFSFPSSNIT